MGKLLILFWLIYISVSISFQFSISILKVTVGRNYDCSLSTATQLRMGPYSFLGEAQKVFSHSKDFLFDIEKEIEKEALLVEKELEKDVIGLEKEIAKDVLEIEKEIERDVGELEVEFEKDVIELEREVGELAAESEPYLIEAVEEVREAAIPQDFDSAVAILLADTISGVMIGYASQNLVEILGNNTYPANTALSGGTFFGTRGLLRAGCMMFGFPDPFDILIATVLAEGIRVLTAKLTNKDGTISEYQVDYANSIGGVSKWIIYDKLIITQGVSADQFVNALNFFTYGIIASAIGFCIKQISKRDKMFDAHPVDIIEFILQGGIMFLIFEEIRSVLAMIVPADFNPVPPLGALVKELEAFL